MIFNSTKNYWITCSCIKCFKEFDFCHFGIGLKYGDMWPEYEEPCIFLCPYCSELFKLTYMGYDHNRDRTCYLFYFAKR